MAQKILWCPTYVKELEIEYFLPLTLCQVSMSQVPKNKLVLLLLSGLIWTKSTITAVCQRITSHHGCSTAVECASHNLEVYGSNPASCLAFIHHLSFPTLGHSLFIHDQEHPHWGTTSSVSTDNNKVKSYGQQGLDPNIPIMMHWCKSLSYHHSQVKVKLAQLS